MCAGLHSVTTHQPPACTTLAAGPLRHPGHLHHLYSGFYVFYCLYIYNYIYFYDYY